MKTIFKTLALGLVASSALGSVAMAQDYPTQPVTIVVPFSAGGPTDTVTRLVAAAMSPMINAPQDMKVSLRRQPVPRPCSEIGMA